MDERSIADFAYDYNDGRKSQSPGVQIENRHAPTQTRPSQSQRRRPRSPIHIHSTRLPTHLRSRDILLRPQAHQKTEKVRRNELTQVEPVLNVNILGYGITVSKVKDVPVSSNLCRIKSAATEAKYELTETS
jgi:hypothetical protein